MDRSRATSPTSSSSTTSDGLFSCQSIESMTSAEVRTPRRKYPAHLSAGVPNRSQKYETMEELLAAAGYTVTRVFTPEAEHTGAKQPDDEDEDEDGVGKKEGGIGGLFAGWFSNILSNPSSPVERTSPVQGPGAHPFLDTSAQYPQTAHSLRTHLMTRALMPHRARDPPTLRHVTSAPSLSAPGRRRGLPSAWREQEAPRWSGGFAAQPSESKRTGWFGTQSEVGRASQASTIRANHTTMKASQGTIRANATRSSLSVRGNHLLRNRARSAPRPSPPVRPSPVVQPSVVVCRSVSSLGSNSSSSVHTRLSVRTDSTDSCPVLAPEPASAEGLPPTPARPVITKQRSGILRRKIVQVKPEPELDDEPDLASIIDSLRPPSPARRQASIRSLRAVLKDPRFPNVPVVCVASPGTVSAGGAGRAIWLRDE